MEIVDQNGKTPKCNEEIKGKIICQVCINVLVREKARAVHVATSVQ